MAKAKKKEDKDKKKKAKTKKAPTRKAGTKRGGGVQKAARPGGMGGGVGSGASALRKAAKTGRPARDRARLAATRTKGQTPTP
jgi:hypothetical protein